MGATAAPSSGIVRGIETFGVGTYPGDVPGETWTYTPDDLKKIVENFHALCDGDYPELKVPVVITHKGVDAHAWVVGVSEDGDLLFTDWEGPTPELRAKVKERRTPEVSAEIQHDFTDRKGNVHPGPYLYRVAVIGADQPRVKGMRSVPANQFADPKSPKPGRRITRTFRFADPKGTIMDLAAALAFLGTKGIDVTPYSDQSPPECQQLAIAVATAWQQADMDATPPPDTGDVTTLSDSLTGPKKVTVTQQYADARRQLAQQTSASLKAISAASAVEAKARQERAAEERVGQVRLFCDRMTTDLRMDPADNEETTPETLRSQMVLLARQPVQIVQRFADSKGVQVEKSALQLMQDRIERQAPRKFSERVAVGTGPGDFYANLRASVKAEKAAPEAKGKTIHERLNLIPGRQSR